MKAIINKVRKNLFGAFLEISALLVLLAVIQETLGWAFQDMYR